MSEITERLTTAIADRYKILSHLGQGGMATVYLAHDVKHDRKVALKVLNPDLAAVIGAERFLQEIRTTANLQHPHILGLHDSGEAGGTVFYVMPYVEGESLRDRIDRERQLPVKEALRITREVADALRYAHGLGVIHRDIKPENILLHGGHALVADFGIALAVSKSEGGTRMTETGMSLGTPHYMSPEQAMGEREITAKSDVYALGCVLYEMLTGEPPFSGPTAQAIVARVLTEEPRRLTLQRSTIPQHVEAAVLTALAKLPADRFGGAKEFADALENPTFTATTAAVGAPADSTDAPARSVPAARILGAVAVAMTGLALWGWFGRSEAPQQVTRQLVTLGEDVQLVTAVPAMALSPDGTRLVFVDDSEAGLLWVKRRDRLDPTPIPGTERAANPVFSPDGEWVAFVADNRLKKVRVDGGATVTLADSAAGGYGGAAWLDDGTLVYVNPTLTQLRRVSAAGGSSTTVMANAPGLGGGGVGIPVALPNARGVLFQYCSSGCVTIEVHVLDLESGNERLLLDDVAQAWHLPQGRLLYVRRDGVALAAPFDLDRLEITGEAVPVLEDVGVRSLNGFSPLVFSPSGTLVYVRGTGGSDQNVFVRVDRTGTISPIDTAWFGPFNGGEVAPGADRMAVGVGAGSGLNIWVKQLDRGPFTRLTFGNADRRPEWSPDGRVVAFLRDSANTSVVYSRPADGSGADSALVLLDQQVQEIEWSPDGRWLVLRTDNGTPGAGDLVGFRLDGSGDTVPLVGSPFTELHPSISPNGRWLAYSSNESGIYEIYVRPFPETDAARSQVSNGGGAEPVWSDDGREIFYLGGDGSLMAAELRPGNTFAVNTAVRLFSVSGFEIDAFHQSFSVLPGGEGFVFLASRELAESDGAPQVVWVDGWFEELRERFAQ